MPKKPNLSGLYVQALKMIEGGLKASADDCRTARLDLADGHQNTAADAVNGAIFHAKEALSRLEKLERAMRSDAATTQTEQEAR